MLVRLWLSVNKKAIIFLVDRHVIVLKALFKSLLYFLDYNGFSQNFFEWCDKESRYKHRHDIAPSVYITKFKIEYSLNLTIYATMPMPYLLGLWSVRNYRELAKIDGQNSGLWYAMAGAFPFIITIMSYQYRIIILHKRLLI